MIKKNSGIDSKKMIELLIEEGYDDDYIKDIFDYLGILFIKRTFTEDEMCRYIMQYEDFWRLFEKSTGMDAPLDELLKQYRTNNMEK